MYYRNRVSFDQPRQPNYFRSNSFHTAEGKSEMYLWMYLQAQHIFELLRILKYYLLHLESYMTKLLSADCWGLSGHNVPPFILEIRWSTSRIKNITTKFQNFLPRKIFIYFSWKFFHSFLQYKSRYQQASKLNLELILIH